MSQYFDYLTWNFSFGTSLTLQWDTTVVTMLVKFELDVEMYIAVTRQFAANVILISLSAEILMLLCEHTCTCMYRNVQRKKVSCYFDFYIHPYCRI